MEERAVYDVIPAGCDEEFSRKDILEVVEGLSYQQMSNWLKEIRVKMEKGSYDDYDNEVSKILIREMEEYKFWKALEQDFAPYGKIQVNLNSSLSGLKEQLAKLMKYQDTILNGNVGKATTTYRKCVRQLQKEIRFREMLKNGAITKEFERYKTPEQRQKLKNAECYESN